MRRDISMSGGKANSMSPRSYYFHHHLFYVLGIRDFGTSETQFCHIFTPSYCVGWVERPLRFHYAYQTILLGRTMNAF